MSPAEPPRTGPRGLAQLGAARLLILVLTSIFCAFWLWAAIYFGVLPVGSTPYNRLGGVAGSDFVFFYPAGVLAAEGRAADIYVPSALTAAGREHLADRTFELVFPYPPTASMALAALGTLPPRIALAAWIGLAIAVLLTAGRILLGRWASAPLILLCPAAGLALFTGQVSPLVMLVLLPAVMRVSNEVASGTAIGLLSLKPHFGIVPGLFSLFARRFTEAGAAIGTLIAMVLISLAVFGTEAWAGFFNLGLSHSQALRTETPFSRLVSVFATAASFGAGVGIAILAHACVAMTAMIAGFRLWRHGQAPSTRALGYVAAILLATPYVLDYDLALTIIPWALLIRESLRDAALARDRFALFIALTLVTPVTYLVAITSGRAVGSLLLLSILGAAYWKESRADPALVLHPVR